MRVTWAEGCSNTDAISVSTAVFATSLKKTRFPMMGIAKPEFASMDSETTPDVFAIRLIIAIIVSPSKYLLYMYFIMTYKIKYGKSF